MNLYIKILKSLTEIVGQMIQINKLLITQSLPVLCHL